MKAYCLKWGNRYNADYVNYLQEMLNSDLVCLTDDPHGLKCEIKILPAISTKWWNKMIFFNEDFIDSPGVFYDLDIYFKKPIDLYQPAEYMRLLFTDWIDLHKLKEHTVDKKHQYCSINSSIMCWDSSTKRQHIWDFYRAHKDKIEFSFSGIDTYIEHRFPRHYTFYEDLNVSSFYRNGSSGDIILFEGVK